MLVKLDNYDCPEMDAVSIEKLADITHVVIDTTQPIPDRKNSYIHQIGNPRLFRCGDTKVRISYGTDDLEERIREYLLSRGRTALI